MITYNTIGQYQMSEIIRLLRIILSNNIPVLCHIENIYNSDFSIKKIKKEAFHYNLRIEKQMCFLMKWQFKNTSHILRKPAFYICKKGTEQLCWFIFCLVRNLIVYTDQKQAF